MSTQTPLLSLTKPDGGDAAQISVINANFDILDNAVTLANSQTLINKTLTAPHMTSAVVDSGGFTVTAGAIALPAGSLDATMMANRTRSLWIPASAFQVNTGGPTFSTATVGAAHWQLRDAQTDGVAASIVAPADWASGAFTFYLYFSPVTAGGAGSREVNITLTTTNQSPGSVVASGSATDDISTSGTNDGLTATAHSRTITPAASGDLIGLAVQRNGSAGTDDLASIVRFYGIRADYTADS